MLGKSHLKIGIISSFIVSTVPVLYNSSILNNTNIHTPKGVISIAGLALAALGAIATDADSQHSKINHMNPVTGAFNGGVDALESMLKTLVNLIITLGAGALILYNSDELVTKLNNYSGLKGYSSQIVYIGAAILIFSGIMGISVARYIPVFGEVYKLIMKTIDMAFTKLKRIWMFLAYFGVGAYIMYYNYNHFNEIMMYLVGLVLMLIAIFPHRTFLHAIEGVVLVNLSVSYILNRLGLGALNGCFLIGYISHIYWADSLTAEGVPISIIPLILEKVGLDAILDNFKVYRAVRAVLSFRLRIPPHFSTGSVAGNNFESVYVLILAFIAISLGYKYGVKINII